MKSVIVLAMRGATPRDFPADELREFMSLHGRLEFSAVSHSPALESRYEELEEKMLGWPRTAENDPFFASSQELAAALERASGHKVVLGFNEFCSPTLSRALDEAAALGAGRILVVTPMMTRGGEHYEKDIAQAVDTARQKHPDIEYIYAWPFEAGEVAVFMAAHIKKFEGG